MWKSDRASKTRIVTYNLKSFLTEFILSLCQKLLSRYFYIPNPVSKLLCQFVKITSTNSIDKLKLKAVMNILDPRHPVTLTFYDSMTQHGDFNP